MTNKLYKNYLYDLGLLIKEKAKDAKSEKDGCSSEGNREYQLGYLMAFHEVVSLMKLQADAFGIDPKVLGLADIDPDIDLL